MNNSKTFLDTVRGPIRPIRRYLTKNGKRIETRVSYGKHWTHDCDSWSEEHAAKALDMMTDLAIMSQLMHLHDFDGTDMTSDERQDMRDKLQQFKTSGRVN